MHLIRRESRDRAPVALAPWDALDRLFDGSLSPFLRRAAAAPLAESSFFTPPVDITQDENEIVLRAELPGVEKDQVEITVQDDALTLKGTKKTETESKEGRYQYVERRYGEFLRTFQLPGIVDAAKVHAEYKDGVLTVRMPVAETAKPRKVDITVN